MALNRQNPFCPRKITGMGRRSFKPRRMVTPSPKTGTACRAPTKTSWPNGTLLIEAGNVFAHFVFPVGPVVAALGAPVVYGVANAFAIEDFGEAIGWAAVLHWPVPVIKWMSQEANCS